PVRAPRLLAGGRCRLSPKRERGFSRPPVIDGGLNAARTANRWRPRRPAGSARAVARRPARPPGRPPYKDMDVMKVCKPTLAALVAAGVLAARAAGQLPLAATPVPPPPDPVGIAPYPPQPTGNTIWSKLGISKE